MRAHEGDHEGAKAFEIQRANQLAGLRGYQQAGGYYPLNSEASFDTPGLWMPNWDIMGRFR
jgi:hypothetical protein